MKTLEKHTIIYDDECPMCNLYTGAFIQTGMLDAEGREAYGSIQPATAALLDQRRACNEIALVDREHQTVTYGIDSLFKVIGHSFPIFKPLFAWQPFRWVMQKVYAFISYNRKVIVPGNGFERAGQCIPDLNLTYRWAYLLSTWLFTSWVLYRYSGLLIPLIPASNLWREFAICGGQMLFQSLTISLLRKDRLISYLGNMMTVSLAGALLLGPVIWLHQTGQVQSSYFALGWFGLVVGGMLLEHIRRVRLLQIHWSASLSWVVYRLLVLWILL